MNKDEVKRTWSILKTGKTKWRFWVRYFTPTIWVNSYIEGNEKRLAICKTYKGKVVWARSFKAEMLADQTRGELDKDGCRRFQAFAENDCQHS